MSKDNYVKVSGNIMFDPAKNLKYVGERNTARNLIAIDIGTDGKKAAFNITAWGETAEKVANAGEGAFITVTGRLFSRSWKDANNEWKREQGVVADEIELPESIGREADPADDGFDDDIPF